MKICISSFYWKIRYFGNMVDVTMASVWGVAPLHTEHVCLIHSAPSNHTLASTGIPVTAGEAIAPSKQCRRWLLASATICFPHPFPSAPTGLLPKKKAALDWPKYCPLAGPTHTCPDSYIRDCWSFTNPLPPEFLCFFHSFPVLLGCMMLFWPGSFLQSNKLVIGKEQDYLPRKQTGNNSRPSKYMPCL